MYTTIYILVFLYVVLSDESLQKRPKHVVITHNKNIMPDGRKNKYFLNGNYDECCPAGRDAV
jgi:hypothetical protein